MVYKAPEPISNPEDLLFLQNQWVTADIPQLYQCLSPLVHFGIEPDEGLLVIDFDADDQARVELTLNDFGCQWTPTE